MILLGIIITAFYIFYLYNKINLNFINDQISKNILFLGIFLLLVGIILKFIKNVERKLPLNLYFVLGGDEF